MYMALILGHVNLEPVKTLRAYARSLYCYGTMFYIHNSKHSSLYMQSIMMGFGIIAININGGPIMLFKPAHDSPSSTHISAIVCQ